LAQDFTTRIVAVTMVKRLAGFQTASPGAAGLDSIELARFQTGLRCETGRLQSLAGAAHIVLHRGKCVYSCAGGVADQARGTRFGLNTLCRLHGATKPLLAVAFLTLVDARRCRLSDPISKYLTFSDVVKRPKSSRCIKAPVEPTLRDLLTMSAGLGYEDSADYKDIMRGIRKGTIANLSQFCDAIVKKPLQSSPGTQYHYSFAYDVLGLVCEKISGLPLEAFMRKWLLDPLGMKDTHFVVPQRKRGRCAELYNATPLKRRKGEGGAAFRLSPYTHKDSEVSILSGGGGILSYKDAGMWGTAADYARFCQMVVAGGVAVNGRRILKASTARSFWKDCLSPMGGKDGRIKGWHDTDGSKKGGWWDYRGLTLMHTFLDLDEPPRGRHARRSRSMWFSGGGGAFWTIDAKRKLVTVSMSQTFGGREDEKDGHGPLAYRVGPYVE